MLRRLFVGLIKGSLLGLAIGAGLHFGLHWTRSGALLGYLIAMASASTAAVLAGKAPWRRDAGIETVLKAIAGLGLGALYYFLVSRYAAVKLPFTPPTFVADAKWTEVPLLVALTSSSLFGMLIELDNTDAATTTKTIQGTRVAPSVEDAEILSERRHSKPPSNVKR